MKTYKDIIDLLEKTTELVYVSVYYPSGRYEWLPVDRIEYLRQLKMIDQPENYPFPCFVSVDSDLEVFIHSKQEN